MTRTTEASVDGCVAAVNATFESLFERIGGWRTAVEQWAAGADETWTRAGIDAIVETLIVPEFTRDGAFTIGAGFVAAPKFLSDAQWHLAWWLGNRNTFGMGSEAPHIRRLEAVEDPVAENFRDYTTLEWWRFPVSTGLNHITGPYVDYLCTDEYTLTLTEPVFFQGRMIGVVGADLYVEDLEQVLLPELRAVGLPVTLVNSASRVVLSTDVHLATGALLRLDGLADVLRAGDSEAVLPHSGHLVVNCPATGLSLVVTTAQGQDG